MCTITSIKDNFEKWMVIIDGMKKPGASAYASAINRISQHYSDETNVNIDIYQIQEIQELKRISTEYSKGGKFQAFGNEKHGLYKAAIKKYVLFFEETKNGCNSVLDYGNTEKDFKKEFEKWLADRYENSTVDSYKSAINTISRHYSQQTNKRIELYTINDIIFINGLVREYGIGGKYQEIGEKGHGTVRAAIAAYARFLEHKKLGYNSQFEKKDLPKEDNQKSSMNVSQQSVPIDKFDFINKVNMNILPVLSFMIILPALSKYIGKILIKRNENNWWKKYVLDKLRETRDLPKDGSKEEYINELDVSACLSIII